MSDTTMDIGRMAAAAGEAARLLKTLSHEGRLMVLCHLVEGEKSVGELEKLIGLSQSALSHHLALLREEELVATRREAQTIYYRLAAEEPRRVLELLHALYCRPRRQN
jgi:ArsR family transcriptional regulator